MLYLASTAWTPEQQVEELERRSLQAMRKDPPFKPRSTDVIVAIPPKCGTTWLVHICDQIRTQGADPDFEEQVPEVTTWIEYSRTLFGIDPGQMKQRADPRVFFSHLPYADVPRGGKLIYCYRDQADALYSFYRFVNTMGALGNRVSLPVFAAYFQRLQWTRRHTQDLVAWWEHRNDDNVLVVFYEDLVEDHGRWVRRVARFMGVGCSEEVIARVVRATTHVEMVRHHSKFAMHSVAIANAKVLGVDPPSPAECCGRVRRDGGRSGDGRLMLPRDVLQGIRKEWQDIVAAKLGFRDLEEMREAWRLETSRRENLTTVQ